MKRRMFVNGIRHFLREFTASAVTGHLIGESTFDWNAYLARADGDSSQA